MKYDNRCESDGGLSGKEGKSRRKRESQSPRTNLREHLPPLFFSIVSPQRLKVTDNIFVQPFLFSSHSRNLHFSVTFVPLLDSQA